jgi:hypothetical protein
MNALASSRSRFPLTNRASNCACPAVPPVTPGPRLGLQRPQRRVMHRAALRPDLPVPLDLRLRDRDHLAEHDRAAQAGLLRAAMTSEDRSPPPRSVPLTSGDASSPAATATIIPGETGTAHGGTGQEDT